MCLFKGFYQIIAHRETIHFSQIYCLCLVVFHICRLKYGLACTRVWHMIKHRLSLLSHQHCPRNKQEWLRSVCTSISSSRVGKEKDKSTTQPQGDSHRRLSPGCDFSLWILLPHGIKKKKKIRQAFLQLFPYQPEQEGIPHSPCCELWIFPRTQLSPGPEGTSLPRSNTPTELAMCLLGIAHAASERLQPIVGVGRDCFVLNLRQQSPACSMGTMWLL